MSKLQVSREELVEFTKNAAARFVMREPAFDIFMDLNDSFLKATQSEYGFIARVFRNEKGPFIKTVAISNIAWNDETRKLYADNAERGMVFGRLDSLFGQVLKTGKTYIALNAGEDEHACGIPSGHPMLQRFLGIPIFRDGVFIGMVGLANGAEYSHELVEELEILLSVTGQLIYATGFEEDRIADGSFFRQPQAIINSFKSGVLSVDQYGTVLSANLSAALIFGYQPDEIVGQQVQSILPPTGDDRFYNSQQQLSLPDSSFGERIEATGIKNNGTHFPIEVTCEQVEDVDQNFTFVIRDITEDKKNERLKNEFISIISHELRTPLTAVHAALSMLTNDAYRPEDSSLVDELTEMAFRNSERLVSLVDEILDYEKLNIGKVEFEFSKVEVNRVIEIVQQTTGILADKEGVQLQFDLPDTPVFVAADEVRIAQVLVNLISNAIRVSKPDSRVRVGVTHLPASSTVDFFVADEGPGMSEENVRNAFEPFRQLDDNPTGVGLGLAICKRIVESHRSVITCQSELEIGTRFSFELYEHFEMPDPVSGGSQNRTEDQPPVLLWIDNQKDSFDHAVFGLGEESIELLYAKNVHMAKSILANRTIDLMVVGHPLLYAKTVEFLKELRQKYTAKSLPVIVFSNGLSSRESSQLRELGADCELKRSWDFGPFREKVNVLLKAVSN